MQSIPKIIAHRGFFNSHPPCSENSIEAFTQAQKLGIFGSEFDIRLTQDKALIVFHDAFHQNLNISKSKVEDIQKIPLPKGEKIPLLEEFLAQGKTQPDFKLIIELKPPTSLHSKKSMVKKVLEKIQEIQCEEQVIFISFSLHICQEFKQHSQNHLVQYLNGDKNPKQLHDLNIDGMNYHYSTLLQNPTWIAEAKELGLQTNSWTVNDNKIFEQLAAQGIDFITTDTPHLFNP